VCLFKEQIMIVFHNISFACVPTARALDHFTRKDPKRLKQAEITIRELATRILRAVLAQRKGLEIEFLQVKDKLGIWAVSSRVTLNGRIELDVDIGDPALPTIAITTEDMKKADPRHRLNMPGRPWATKGRS
jgi:hypothetical protein